MRTPKSRDLQLTIDPLSSAPLYQQVYESIRQQIIEGALTEGDYLPSIKGAAETHNLSHITIEKAYLQLAVEGYVDSIPRSGHVVNGIDTGFLKKAPRSNQSEVAEIVAQSKRSGYFSEISGGRTNRYDFSFARLEPGSFPTRTWLKLTGDILHENDEVLTNYPIENRPTNLQTELASFLQRTRGVNCTPKQIVVTPSTEAALTIVAQLFDGRRHRIGLEEPGYAAFAEIAGRFGYTVEALPVNQGVEAFLEHLSRSNVKLVFATPSHQFPTGALMPLESRISFLKLAARKNFYIIEDDSCNELRYNTRPIPSLQSLDTLDKVIYLGNFSKILSPGLRTAYLVLPPKLLKRYYERFSTSFSAVPTVVQEVLARFISEGHMDQHVRKMVTSNRKRHDALLACIERTMKGRVSLSGVDSGLHFFATVHNGMTQRQLIDSAAKQGAKVYSSHWYWFEGKPSENQLIIGFSAISLSDVPDGVRALKQAWFE